VFIDRATWGAKAPNGIGNPLGKPKGVAIHWEGPKMGSPQHSLCAHTVRSIQAFHQNGRGWSDIAYNLLVCQHGYVFEGRGVHKGSAANGTDQGNLDYHSICALVGEGDPTPQAMLDGIKEARALCLKAGVGTKVVGHRDLNATACPGDALYTRVRSGYFATGVTRVVVKASRAITKARTDLTSKITLRTGSEGVAVRRLQAGLNRTFPAYSRLAVDGKFGPATDRVVREFQRRSRLGVDGVVGPVTRAALKRVGITF
jgi:hypothetical protein